MANDNDVPDETNLRERFQDLTNEASDTSERVEDLAERVEKALRQLDENRHYGLWSSFCESRGDLGRARDSLAQLRRTSLKLNFIFTKLCGEPALSASDREAALFEAEEEVESAEGDLAEAKRLYEAAQEPDPDNLPPNLD